MLENLGIMLLTISVSASAYCSDNQFTQHLKPTSNKQSSIDCPQCGVWAISAAYEVSGPHGEAGRRLDGPVGSYVFADDTEITIPYCGEFAYKVKGTDVSNDQGKKRYHYTMDLTKKNDSLLCKGDEWTLELVIYSGAFDQASHAQFNLTTNSDIPPREIEAWNINRTDPAESDGTPGIGQVALFKVAETKKALAVAAMRNYQFYIKEGDKPFDVERFAYKVKQYCEDYYQDGSYNPSIGNLMIRCEYMVLAAKYDEFVNWKCENNKHKCSLPNEEIRKE